MLPIAPGKSSAALIVDVLHEADEDIENALLEREFLHANIAGQRCESTFIHHYPV